MTRRIHPTKPSDLGEVILVRKCKIEFEGEVSPLTLSFIRPKFIGNREVEGSLRFECRHFDETLTLTAGDDIQLLTALLSVGKAWLHLMRGDGFTVWLHTKDDFDFFDFWSYQEKPHEYCLPSAFQDAMGEAFYRVNAGKSLMPSHRVAVELDRPGVTTYAVQPDGTDNVAGSIGPDDMKGISPDELCRRLGRMILNGSEEGRQLLAKRRESKDYPTNARSST
jgi:hypothetical protein